MSLCLVLNRFWNQKTKQLILCLSRSALRKSNTLRKVRQNWSTYSANYYKKTQIRDSTHFKSFSLTNSFRSKELIFLRFSPKPLLLFQNHKKFLQLPQLKTRQTGWPKCFKKTALLMMYWAAKTLISTIRIWRWWPKIFCLGIQNSRIWCMNDFYIISLVSKFYTKGHQCSILHEFFEKLFQYYYNHNIWVLL